MKIWNDDEDNDQDDAGQVWPELDGGIPERGGGLHSQVTVKLTDRVFGHVVV